MSNLLVLMTRFIARSAFIGWAASFTFIAAQANDTLVMSPAAFVTALKSVAEKGDLGRHQEVERQFGIKLQSEIGAEITRYTLVTSRPEFHEIQYFSQSKDSYLQFSLATNLVCFRLEDVWSVLGRDFDKVDGQSSDDGIPDHEFYTLVYHLKMFPLVSILFHFRRRECLGTATITEYRF